MAKGNGQTRQLPNQGKAFAMMQQESLVTPNGVIGMISIHGVNTCILIVPKAIHSFVSHSLVVQVCKNNVL